MTRRASVIIPTYNRASLLRETLERIASLRPYAIDWDVVVVDNNSTDATRETVGDLRRHYPVPLEYVFEPRQGRSWALNAGIDRSSAPALLFTDDDVIVGDDWLNAAIDPLTPPKNDAGISYTGGPVRPIWEAPRPAWLAAHRSDLWGTIAILDYGREPFVFEERRRVPLGANMAVSRSLFERIGRFDGRLGRTGTGKHVLGQEVPEFLARSRAYGARGLYVPAMTVDHHVPAQRLTKEYFRRWWYGKGMSRAELDRLQPVTELGVDLNKVRHLANVPVFMLRTALGDVLGWIGSTLRIDPEERFRHEMMLCYFAGYFTARQRRPRPLRPAVAS
jgi:glycosyltransferase involved in cell wall biosynthesis